MRSFTGYLAALFKRELMTESYRRYVTDSLQLSGRGMFLANRWHDLTHPNELASLSAEQIVDRVIESAELEVI